MDTVSMILTVPAILALVNLAKTLGLPTRLAALAAVLLGVGLSIAHVYLAGTPVWGALTTGAILGLSAAGLYDTAKATGTTTIAPRSADQ